MRLRKPANRVRLYGWWYLTIGLGFLLLSIRGVLFGERVRMIALRLAIAAGYGILGVIQLRAAGAAVGDRAASILREPSRVARTGPARPSGR
ncbi:MAG: hypothetical protein FJW37_04520 [Acidobacteria bacterium]|nr:hypothetical protein [Acidobacteriota bacterium]